MEEEQEDADWGDSEPTPPAAPLEPATTTSAHGLDPSTSTTWGPFEQLPQPVPAAPEEALAVVEGEATSSREALCHIQRRHPPQTMIGNIDQRVTWSRSYHISHFAHSAFVASFEPRDVGHALSDPDWVNAMHEELKNFERNQVWVLVPPQPECHPIRTKWVFKNKQSEDGVVVRNKARLVAQGFCQKKVDDIIFGVASHALVAKFADLMNREFEMSMMGELTFFLGLQIKQTREGTFVHQGKYTKDVLKKLDMGEAKPLSTPMSTTTALDADEEGEAVDLKEYRNMIGLLLLGCYIYLTATRPDIQFVVCLCARFQASPHTSHRQAAKRIMRPASGWSFICTRSSPRQPLHCVGVKTGTHCASTYILGSNSTSPVAKYFLALVVELLEAAASARRDTAVRMAMAAALNCPTATVGRLRRADPVLILVTGIWKGFSCV
ncbi:hypothetical protein ACQ4PT_040317 [Festuca glaucescens]